MQFARLCIAIAAAVASVASAAPALGPEEGLLQTKPMFAAEDRVGTDAPVPFAMMSLDDTATRAPRAVVAADAPVPFVVFRAPLLGGRDHDDGASRRAAPAKPLGKPFFKIIIFGRRGLVNVAANGGDRNTGVGPRDTVTAGPARGRPETTQLDAIARRLRRETRVAPSTEDSAPRVGKIDPRGPWVFIRKQIIRQRVRQERRSLPVQDGEEMPEVGRMGRF